MDKEFDRLSKTKCKHSYNERHYWERRGLVRSVKMIWECYNCELCIREKLEFLEE